MVTQADCEKCRLVQSQFRRLSDTLKGRGLVAVEWVHPSHGQAQATGKYRQGGQSRTWTTRDAERRDLIIRVCAMRVSEESRPRTYCILLCTHLCLLGAFSSRCTLSVDRLSYWITELSNYWLILWIEMLMGFHSFTHSLTHSFIHSFIHSFMVLITYNCFFLFN